MKRFFLFALCFSATITLFLIPANIVLAFEPLFNSPLNYDTGDGPVSVFAGDLDGDSDLDLAVANYNSDSVSVLLNNGDGTYAEAVNYGAGDGPRSVFAGDLDGDGDLDLAVANSGSDNVSVLLNNGDGTYAVAVNYAAGDGPSSVFAGDLDGDSDLDLAVANSGSDNVSILLNNGDGTYAAAVNYAAGNDPDSVFAGDFNGDGDLDLTVANGYSDNVSVLLNNGDGTYAAVVYYNVDSGNTPSSVCAGDLDGDSDLDLAVVGFNLHNVLVLLNNGDGTYASAVTYHLSEAILPVTICVGDLDEDGDLDLAVANKYSDNVSVLLNNGDGTYAAAVYFSAGDSPRSVFAGDLDGDGDLDLAVANSGSDNVSVLINLTEGFGFCPIADSGTLLFAELYSTEANTIGLPLGERYAYSTNSFEISRLPNERLFVSGSPDRLDTLIYDDDMIINNTLSVGGGPYTIRNYDFPRNVPINVVLEPIEAQEITDLIPIGTSCVKFALVDTQREVFGNTAIYLIKQDKDPILIQCPSDTFIPPFTNDPLLPISGFKITNISNINLAFDYSLSAEGPATLADNGNPESILGTTPLLAPGAAYSPPEPVLELVPLREYAQEIITHAVSVVDFPEIADTCEMLIEFEPPVATQLQSYSAYYEESAIYIRWTLSEASENAEFFILRSENVAGTFKELPSAEIINKNPVFIFKDKSCAPGKIYFYRVEISNKDCRQLLFKTNPIAIKALLLTLSQNIPNPFNPSTVIRYYLPEKCHVSLDVYDITGRRIASLLKREQKMGSNSVEWNGKDWRGNSVASGIYFYKLKVGKKTITKKMVLLR